MEETELLKQLTEIAERESYVLLPKAYYEKLFNAFDRLKTDMIRARESRDKWKEEAKDLKSQLSEFKDVTPKATEANK